MTDQPLDIATEELHQSSNSCSSLNLSTLTMQINPTTDADLTSPGLMHLSSSSCSSLNLSTLTMQIDPTTDVNHTSTGLTEDTSVVRSISARDPINSFTRAVELNKTEHHVSSALLPDERVTADIKHVNWLHPNSAPVVNSTSTSDTPFSTTEVFQTNDTEQEKSDLVHNRKESKTAELKHLNLAIQQLDLRVPQHHRPECLARDENDTALDALIEETTFVATSDNDLSEPKLSENDNIVGSDHEDVSKQKVSDSDSKVGSLLQMDAPDVDHLRVPLKKRRIRLDGSSITSSSSNGTPSDSEASDLSKNVVAQENLDVTVIRRQVASCWSYYPQSTALLPKRFYNFAHDSSMDTVSRVASKVTLIPNWLEITKLPPTSGSYVYEDESKAHMNPSGIVSIETRSDDITQEKELWELCQQHSEASVNDYNGSFGEKGCESPLHDEPTRVSSTRLEFQSKDQARLVDFNHDYGQTMASTSMSSTFARSAPPRLIPMDISDIASEAEVTTPHSSHVSWEITNFKRMMIEDLVALQDEVCPAEVTSPQILPMFHPEHVLMRKSVEYGELSRVGSIRTSQCNQSFERDDRHSNNTKVFGRSFAMTDVDFKNSPIHDVNAGQIAEEDDDEDMELRMLMGKKLRRSLNGRMQQSNSVSAINVTPSPNPLMTTSGMIRCATRQDSYQEQQSWRELKQRNPTINNPMTSHTRAMCRSPKREELHQEQGMDFYEYEQTMAFCSNAYRSRSVTSSNAFSRNRRQTNRHDTSAVSVLDMGLMDSNQLQGSPAACFDTPVAHELSGQSFWPSHMSRTGMFELQSPEMNTSRRSMNYMASKRHVQNNSSCYHLEPEIDFRSPEAELQGYENHDHVSDLPSFHDIMSSAVFSTPQPSPDSPGEYHSPCALFEVATMHNEGANVQHQQMSFRERSLFQRGALRNEAGNASEHSNPLLSNKTSERRRSNNVHDNLGNNFNDLNRFDDCRVQETRPSNDEDYCRISEHAINLFSPLKSQQEVDKLNRCFAEPRSSTTSSGVTRRAGHRVRVTRKPPVSRDIDSSGDQQARRRPTMKRNNQSHQKQQLSK